MIVVSDRTYWRGIYYQLVDRCIRYRVPYGDLRLVDVSAASVSTLMARVGQLEERLNLMKIG